MTEVPIRSIVFDRSSLIALRDRCDVLQADCVRLAMESQRISSHIASLCNKSAEFIAALNRRQATSAAEQPQGPTCPLCGSRDTLNTEVRVLACFYCHSCRHWACHHFWEHSFPDPQPH